MVVKSNSLENIIQAEGFIAISDTHGKVEPLRSALSYANDNSLALVYNGDFINDYHFTAHAQELGFQFVDNLRLEHYQKYLSQNDLEAYFLARTLSQVSLEELMNSQQTQEQKNYLEQEVEYIQSELFNKKILNLEEKFQQEHKQELLEENLKLRALYEVIIDEQAKEFANELNSHSDVKVLYNLGNHENIYFVEQVRQYLRNKEQIVDLTNSQGHYELAQSNGHNLSLAGMTNCYVPMGYLNEIYSSQEASFLTQHMLIKSEVQADLLSKGKFNDSLESLEDKIKQDSEYQRITSAGEESFDVFFSHGQIGEVKTNSNNGIDVPYSLTAAYFSSKSQLTVEGHIHSKYSGINSFGTKLERPVGRDALIVQKQEDGSLFINHLEVDSTFDGNHNNPLNIEKKYLLQRVEEVVAYYKQMITQSQEEKKAA